MLEAGESLGAETEGGVGLTETNPFSTTPPPTDELETVYDAMTDPIPGVADKRTSTDPTPMQESMGAAWDAMTGEGGWHVDPDGLSEWATGWRAAPQWGADAGEAGTQETEIPDWADPSAPGWDGALGQGPGALSEEAQAALESLEPEARDAVLAHTEALETRLAHTERQLQEAAAPSELDTAYEKWASYATAQGVTPSQAIDYLFAAHQELTHAPVDRTLTAIDQLVRETGIHPRLVASHLVRGEDPRQPFDAERARLAGDLARAQSQNQLMETAHRQAAEAQHMQAVGAELADFAGACDASGQLLHPHFEALAEEMAILFENGFTGSLDDAYREASWRNPQIRDAMVHRDLRAAQSASLRRSKAQRRANARRAAAATLPSSGPRAQPATPRSQRDTMERVADRFYG